MDCSPDCITHCTGICSRLNGLYLSISCEEKLFFEKSGTQLVQIDSEPTGNGRLLHRRTNACGYTSDNLCSIHPSVTGDSVDLRPQVCRDFKPGSRPCLVLRAENPDGVKAITRSDINFQKWYFGETED